MNQSPEPWALRVLSGEDRSVGASLLRGVLSIAEPFYAAAMLARNVLYDARILASHKLLRPTISVGNLTTGGTGKTPVVRWLAERLIENNLRPAILMRGYRSDETGGSDEQRMLQNLLGDAAIVIANPDRIAGAADAMRRTPPPDVFLLDDAFQHRRVGRDFDLLLINASNPFGHGHVLPRGLLREPAGAGRRRADAILVTHDDPAKPLQFDARSPVFRCSHVHAGVRDPEGTLLPVHELRREKFFAFSGIADPTSLHSQLSHYGDTFAGLRAFDDHHAYTEEDLARLGQEASRAGAAMLVTTEKDWVKVAKFGSAAARLPIRRLELRLEFHADGEAQLLEQVMTRITAARQWSSSEAAAEAAPAAAKSS